jgi:hypothetical protein
MSQPSDVPAPAGCERDADGRLVGLVFDSAPPLPAPNDNPWLLAVDGSDNALRAVAHAARQAGAMTACALHLVSVQPWLSREAAAAELAQRAWHTTARARSLLDAHGQPWRLHVAMGEAAEQIAAWPDASVVRSSSSAVVGWVSAKACCALRWPTSWCTSVRARCCWYREHNVLSAPTFDSGCFSHGTEFLELSFGDELS